MKKVDDVCDVCIIIFFLPPLSFFFICFPWNNKGTSKAFSQIRKGVGYFQIGCCYSHGTTRYIYHVFNVQSMFYLILYVFFLWVNTICSSLQIIKTQAADELRPIHFVNFISFLKIFLLLQYVPTLFDWYKSLFGYFFYPLCICTHSKNQGEQ